RSDAAADGEADRPRLVSPRAHGAAPPQSRARRDRGPSGRPPPARTAQGHDHRRPAGTPRQRRLDRGAGGGAGAARARGGVLMAELPEPPTPTLSAIYASYEARQGDGFRDHLGASLIGKPCARALWYDFRWAAPARHPGRILRLFETGQLEEARLVRDLRATGATGLEVDPEPGRQFGVEAHGGHFAGSLDGVALGLLEAPKTWHLLEFTPHSAKSFAVLVAKGAPLAKAQHAAQ